MIDPVITPGSVPAIRTVTGAGPPAHLMTGKFAQVNLY
jgi:hypothetical protein